MIKRFCFVFIFANLIAHSKCAFAGEPADTVQTTPKRYLFLPLAFRTPETDWGVGLFTGIYFKAKKNDTTLRTSDVSIAMLYTLNKQALFIVNSSIYLPKEKNIIRFQSSYAYAPDKFWGLGNNTPEEALEDYNITQINFHIQYLAKLYRGLYVGLNYDFQKMWKLDYSEGGIFDEQNIYGRDGCYTSGLGALLTWDKRNNAFSPSKGSFAEINFTTFNKAIGSTYNFISATLDARKFIALSPTTVLGIQAYIKASNGEVAYRNLGIVGGPEMMRGYYRGRYTDNDVMQYQAEIRQHLFWRLGATGFFAVGEVSPDIKHFSLPGFYYSYGGGLRITLKEKEKLNLRIDYGVGKNTSGLYVVLKEAF